MMHLSWCCGFIGTLSTSAHAELPLTASCWVACLSQFVLEGTIQFDNHQSSQTDFDMHLSSTPPNRPTPNTLDPRLKCHPLGQPSSWTRLCRPIAYMWFYIIFTSPWRECFPIFRGKQPFWNIILYLKSPNDDDSSAFRFFTSWHDMPNTVNSKEAV